MHSKPRPVPHSRVLPPGEFNGIIQIPLSVYPKSFTMIAATVFMQHCNIVTNMMDKKQYLACYGCGEIRQIQILTCELYSLNSNFNL